VIAAPAPRVPPAAPRGPFRYQVRFARGGAPTAAWEDLAADAAHPNPFFEPFMLAPALAHLGGAGVEIALVHAVPDRGAPFLCGLAPIACRRWRGLPVRCVSVWRYAHCYDATPLLRRGHEREALDALFDALDAPLVELGGTIAEGEVHHALIEVLARRGLEAHAWGRFVRALLRPAASAEDYRARISTGKRKELRRQARRLAELGRLGFEAAAATPRGLAELLDLEQRGWKGRGGTALGSSLADRRFFAAMSQAGAAAGKLALLAMRLDGRAVAMKLNLVGSDRAWAWKIAYDEALARFSPGVQLELHNIDWVHARPRLRQMDSCAAARHPMIDGLWRERIAFESLLVARGRAAAALAAAVPLLRWGGALLRRDAEVRR
jgi:hypothetical protein